MLMYAVCVPHSTQFATDARREHWHETIDVEALMRLPDPRVRRRRRLVRLALLGSTVAAIGLGARFALRRRAA